MKFNLPKSKICFCIFLVIIAFFIIYKNKTEFFDDDVDDLIDELEAFENDDDLDLEGFEADDDDDLDLEGFEDYEQFEENPEDEEYENEEEFSNLETYDQQNGMNGGSSLEGFSDIMYSPY